MKTKDDGPIALSYEKGLFSKKKRFNLSLQANTFGCPSHTADLHKMIAPVAYHSRRIHN